MTSTKLIMGMPISLTTYGGREAAMRAVQERAFDYFAGVDETFSPYKVESEISRWNRGEFEAAGVVREVLELCEMARRRTEGYFDVRRPDGLVNPSGLVKGWAVEQVASLLETAGVEHFCVEAGGDLQVRGRNGEGRPWRVGIRDPRDRRRIVKVLELTDGAVATSGTYERGEHIYNPRTGQPAREVLSLTVVGPRITWVDVCATAGFAMGLAGAEWVAAQGLEAYQVQRDGRAVLTRGLAGVR